MKSEYECFFPLQYICTTPGDTCKYEALVSDIAAFWSPVCCVVQMVQNHSVPLGL